MIIMVVYDNDDEHWLGNLTNEFTQVDSESLYCEPTQYNSVRAHINLLEMKLNTKIKILDLK